MASLVSFLSRHGTHGDIVAPEAWAETTWVDKLDLCLKLMLHRSFGLPSVTWLMLFIVHGCFIIAFVLLAYFTTRCLDEKEDSWAYWDTLYYKFNAWFYIVECLGFGMCYIGSKGVGTLSWYFRFVPGVIKVPAIPLPFVGFRRTYLDVLLHVVSLLGACVLLVLPRVGASELRPVVFIELASYIFDYTPAHHQFYNFLPMLALCFSSQSGGFAGAQFAILGLYFFSGLAKLPVWAKYNNAFVLAFSRWFVENDYVHKLMYKGSDDATLTTFSKRVVALSGIFVEAGGPVALVIGPIVGCSFVSTLGFFVLISMHVVIMTSMPLDIITFNAYYMVSVTYLFRCRFDSLDRFGVSNMDPFLVALLALRLVYVLYGFACPTAVHYLTHGWRIWAGNWTMSYVMIRKSAMERLQAQVKSNIPAPSSSLNSVELAFGITYRWLVNLNGKALPMVISRMLQCVSAEDEYIMEDLGAMQGWMMGQTWGDANVMQAQTSFFVEECGFKESDCLFCVLDAFPWLSSSVQFSVYDVCSGLVSQGRCTVAQLEQVVARPSASLSLTDLLASEEAT